MTEPFRGLISAQPLPSGGITLTTFGLMKAAMSVTPFCEAAPEARRGLSQ
ncbi:hypothetical protein [Streptomyces sp. NPDC093984]